MMVRRNGILRFRLETQDYSPNVDLTGERFTLDFPPDAEIYDARAQRRTNQEDGKVSPRNSSDLPVPNDDVPAAASTVAADSTPQPTKERQYGSNRPLYFRVACGKEGRTSMLGVIDESEGAGTGYDTAFVDENMNNDFTDDRAKEFPVIRSPGNPTGRLHPEFGFNGPFGEKGRAKYTLIVHTLTRKGSGGEPQTGSDVAWGLVADGWNCSFFGGTMKLFSSVADAARGTPVRLGGEYKWEIGLRNQDGEVSVTATLKDDNGCTLATVFGPNGNRYPTLTLIKDARVAEEGRMNYAGGDVYELPVRMPDGVCTARVELDMGPHLGKVKAEKMLQIKNP